MKQVFLSTGVVILLFTGAFFYLNQGAEAPSDENEANISDSDGSLEAIEEGQSPGEANETQDSAEMPNSIQLTLKTQKGDIEMELYPNAAPKTVENFVKLARENFYDGVRFHRVVPGFVIQGGDPLSKTNDPKVGTGGPGYTFEDEINPKSLGLTDEQIASLEAQGYKYNYDLQSLPVDAGTIAMANSGPNTNGSQFFIVTESAQTHLNGKHTVFGKVTKGMDVVLNIEQGNIIEDIVLK